MIYVLHHEGHWSTVKCSWPRQNRIGTLEMCQTFIHRLALSLWEFELGGRNHTRESEGLGIRLVPAPGFRYNRFYYYNLNLDTKSAKFGGCPDKIGTRYFFDGFLVPIRYNPAYFFGKIGPLCLKSNIRNVRIRPRTGTAMIFYTCMTTKRLTTPVPDPSGAWRSRKMNKRKWAGPQTYFLIRLK